MPFLRHRRLVVLTWLAVHSLSVISEEQWNLHGRYGVHIPPFYNETAPVAVLDSGFESAVGWDFISDASISGDGDGRDSNASDPGTGMWHGTKVASIIAGSGGLEGVSPGSPLFSIRVLGLGDKVGCMFVCMYDRLLYLS